MLTISEKYCFIKLFAATNNNGQIIKIQCLWGMQKNLATDFGPVGLEFDLSFRENLICNKNKTTLELGTEI